MAQFNVPDHSLNSAFLLLSGCETDLARKAKRRGASVDATAHYGNAQKYLFKVYGDPALAAAAATQAKLAQSAAPKVSTPPSEPRSVHRQCKILEREVQCLRDRNVQQSQTLADIRASKRRLEDDVDTERSQRRKLERSLRDAEKEKETARRMENHALDQVKREVECRRRAEDRAKELEREAVKKDPKPFLEGLAQICQRAASGTFVSLPGIASLPARPPADDRARPDY